MYGSQSWTFQLAVMSPYLGYPCLLSNVRALCGAIGLIQNPQPSGSEVSVSEDACLDYGRRTDETIIAIEFAGIL